MGPIRTQDGVELQLLPGPIESFRRNWNGEILLPGSDEYEGSRRIWNGMIDRRPAVVLRCGSASDVVSAVRLIAEHRLTFSVRGGGHHIAGNAVCEGGVQIDMSRLRAIKVDPVGRRATVQAGCTLADVDAATQAHGLATPLGINSTTGVAGLTLGGGFGWLSRRWGMTVDNLRSADIVTADGQLRHVSETENADLFWAIRGGGGNFGVVTQFEYALHPVGPTVLSGLIVHPLQDAPNLLAYYRAYSAALPDELAVWVVLRKAPPLPFLPAQWHGREVLIFAVCYSGINLADGERLLAPLRRYGHPIADVVGPAPYAAWQQAFDPLLAPGARNYWKSHDFVQLPDAFLDTVSTAAAALPTPECEIFIGQLGGHAGRVPVEQTAYAHRHVHYVMNVHTRWQDPAEDQMCVTWARNFFAETAPFSAGSVYSNFMTGEETDRVGAAFGANYPRLAQIKSQHDPSNLFRMNVNIAPAASALAQPRP